MSETSDTNTNPPPNEANGWSEWLENTATGEKGRFRRDPSDPESLIIELVIAPGSPGPPPHMHPGQDEKFAVRTGLLVGKIGRKRFEARPGDEIFAPRMVPHAWWNGSETEELRVMGTVTPAFQIDRMLKIGWAMMSRLGPDRRPPLPMVAVIFQEFRQEAGLPIPLFVQRELFGLLAPLGRRKYAWVLKDPSEWPTDWPAN